MIGVVINKLNEQLKDRYAVYQVNEQPEREDSFPRIIWTLGEESFSAPEGGGGDGVSEPAPLVTRNINVDCHVWGKDEDQCDDIFSDVFNVVHDSMWGSFGVAGARWVHNDQAVVIHGIAYVATFVFKIPVTRRATVRARTHLIPITPDSVS